MNVLAHGRENTGSEAKTEEKRKSHLYPNPIAAGRRRTSKGGEEDLVICLRDYKKS